MSTQTQITYTTCIFVTSNIRRLNSKALITNWFKTRLGHCDFWGQMCAHGLHSLFCARSREASRENAQLRTYVDWRRSYVLTVTGFHCNWADFQKAQITYCHKGESETRWGMGLSLMTCAAQDEGVNYYMGGGLAVLGPRIGLDWCFLDRIYGKLLNFIKSLFFILNF